MLNTKGPAESPKSAYFRRIADSKQKQLHDSELRLVNVETELKYFTGTGKPIPAELAKRVDYYRREVRRLRNEMQRALFQVKF